MTPEQVRITPLQWSDEREPCEDCRYNHVVADSGLGSIRIEWKGWKEFDSRTVYVAGEQVGNADTLKEAKLIAEDHIRQIVTSLIEPPLAMQAQTVEPVCRNCMGFGWEPSIYSGRIDCSHCKTAPQPPQGDKT